MRLVQELSERTKSLSMLITISMVANLVPWSTGFGEDIVLVRNVRFEASNQVVVVSYDLLGLVDREYKVTLTLKKEGDALFQYRPAATRGNIGIGRFAGRGRRIIWDISGDYPDGLEGNDYYFIVEAQQIQSESSTLPWIVGGAGILVANIGMFVLLSSKENTSKSVEIPTTGSRP